MDVRDFVTNRNPEFAMNIELFEEHEDENNLEGEENEEFMRVQRENWNEGEQWMIKHNKDREDIYNDEWQVYLNPVLQKIQNLNSVNFQTLHNIFHTRTKVFTFCQWGGAFKKGTGQFDYILDLDQKENKTIKPTFQFLDKHPVKRFPVVPFALGCSVDPKNPRQ